MSADAKPYDPCSSPNTQIHSNDVLMGAIASQVTSLASVYSAVQIGADQRKHQSSESFAFVRGIHLRPVNSPHKRPVTRKMFPFDDVIMGIFRESEANTMAADVVALRAAWTSTSMAAII